MQLMSLQFACAQISQKYRAQIVPSLTSHQNFFYHFNFIFHNLFFSSTTSNKNGEKASLQAFTAPQHYQRAEQHFKKEEKKTVKIN